MDTNSDTSSDAEFIEKLKSLHVARSSRRRPKVTTDVHDSYKVEVKEHWNDRVDVKIKPETLKIKAKGVVNGK